MIVVDASVVANLRYSYWVQTVSAYGVLLSNASAANGMRLADPFDAQEQGAFDIQRPAGDRRARPFDLRRTLAGK